MLGQGRTMQDIIATSLDLEKLKRGQLKLELEDVDLFDTVRQSFEALEGMAARKKVELSLRGEGGCAESGTLTRRLDPTHLRRCTDNLIKNAIEASPKGERVAVTVGDPDGGARIRVHNGGDPIPPDVRPYLFHAYSTYGKRGGTGLGVYGVKLTVEAMGGTIDYETGAQGTTFTITFGAADTDERPSS
jgi:signal transduction histidine kinase